VTHLLSLKAINAGDPMMHSSASEYSCFCSASKPSWLSAGIHTCSQEGQLPSVTPGIRAINTTEGAAGLQRQQTLAVTPKATLEQCMIVTISVGSERAGKQCYEKAEPARQCTRKRLADLQAAEVRQGVHCLPEMPKSLPQPRAELHGGHGADVVKSRRLG
jgi:hypothetical protein